MYSFTLSKYSSVSVFCVDARSSFISLKKISEKLPEDEFVWVDRGYLCNLYHVKQIKDNQMVLSTGQQLYIGERRLAQLKHRIMEYWQAGTDNGKWSTND